MPPRPPAVHPRLEVSVQSAYVGRYQDDIPPSEFESSTPANLLTSGSFRFCVSQPALDTDRGDSLEEAVFPKTPASRPTSTGSDWKEISGSIAGGTLGEPRPGGVTLFKATGQQDVRHGRDDPQVVLAAVEERMRAWGAAGAADRSVVFTSAVVPLTTPLCHGLVSGSLGVELWCSSSLKSKSSLSAFCCGCIGSSCVMSGLAPPPSFSIGT